MAARKQERLVNLTIALLSTRHPATREELRAAVTAYQDLGQEAFERQFERDKDALREMGIPVETVSVDKLFGDTQGYRIARSRFELPPIDLTPDEATAVALAARSWQRAAMGEETASAVAKLRAAGLEPDTDRVTALELGFALEAASDASPTPRTLWRAIRDRRVVTFTYHGRRRILQPWVVALRRGAWYVAGYDVERDEPRLFRLSRIEDEVAVTSRAGTFEIPDGIDARYITDRLDAVPAQVARLAVTSGAPRSLLGRARRVDEDAPLPGYLLVDVNYSDARTLVTEVCAAAPEALVVAPAELRAMARKHLLGLEGAVDGA